MLGSLAAWLWKDVALVELGTAERLWIVEGLLAWLTVDVAGSDDDALSEGCWLVEGCWAD